jgi:hydrogenase small subunit
MGCKGPEANFNCPTVRWNNATSWPVKSGHGCIACASPRFWDTKSPFYERLPHATGFGVDVTASEIGWTFVGAVAAATAAHGIAHAVRGKLHPETGTTETGEKTVPREEK